VHRRVNGKDPKQQKDCCADSATGGSATFDLAAFVRVAYAKAWPLDNKELQALVQEKKFADAIDARRHRNPPAPVLAAASKDGKLVSTAAASPPTCAISRRRA